MTNLDSMKNVRLGDVLVAQGLITEAQLEAALERQSADKGRRLGYILEEMGLVTEPQKLEALGLRLGLPQARVEGYPIDLEAVARIPRALADKHTLIALIIQDGQLVVAVNDPLNFFAIEDVRQAAGMPLSLVLAQSADIERAIGIHYAEVGARAAVLAVNEAVQEATPALDIVSDASGEEAPVVRLLNSLLIRGMSVGASDIHIEPFRGAVTVRIRVDGTIVDYTTLALSVHQPLIARIKILANLDIAEKRVPQDGHFRLTALGDDLNLRVSLVPTVHGEKAVLRFLAQSARIDHDDAFGMDSASYRKMLEALKTPHGMVYLTGPTGSGKTTTLYMMLEHLARQPVNIATIEDPVERNISRVNQMQVNPVAGLTFDSGLRAILRQDPDIIMVGETRDAETAAISVRAAITGHLVLSTLHTNDAVSSIVRLRDMGVPAYLIASSLVAVVAQRLVRKVCPECGFESAPTAEQRAHLPPDIETVRRGRGCLHCNGTGYRGRVAVHEILMVDRRIRAMITAEASNDEIFDYARQQGMTTLREDALELVRRGITTVEELLKTAYYELA